MVECVNSHFKRFGQIILTMCPFHESDVIFTFVVSSEMYHNVSMTINLCCQKDGTTLSEGWDYFALLLDPFGT